MTKLNGKALYVLFAAAAFTFILAASRAAAQDRVTILFTSNLGGNFNLDLKDQDKTDPMLMMGQSILYEADKGNGLFIDLGNSFYPGVISKYSYGAAMMDFFSFFNCKTSLISSQDLRLGIDSLQFLQGDSGTKLLSANIEKDGQALFNPFIIEKIKNHTVAFVGLSSKKVLFDVAEKQLYGVTVADEKEVMKKTIDMLKEKSVTNIILLSGLEYQENMELLNDFKEIDCIVTGGDSKGKALGGKIVRIDTEDGRSIVTVPPAKGYCLLSLTLDKGADIADIVFKPVLYRYTADQKYKSFQNRITLWKKQFLKETDKEVVNTGKKKLVVDQEQVANLLRDRYRAEVAVIGKDAVNRMTKEGIVSYENIFSSVNDNYSIFTMRLTGDELKSVKGSLKNYTVVGIDDKGMVQGYPINPVQMYHVVGTQGGYEEIKKIVSRDFSYDNKWDTLLDVAVDDLSGEKVLLSDDFRYLERRFFFFTSIVASFYYEKTDIYKSKNTTTPAGESDDRYYKWGVESQLNLILYNNLHKLTLTPYINYSRQDKEVQNNLLRGTFVYELNLSKYGSPYHKLMADTVVTPVSIQKEADRGNTRRDFRPVNLRETIGSILAVTGVTVTLGVGYEKHVHDTVEPMVMGVEFDLKMQYSFLKYFTYSLDYDSFVSFLGEGGAATDQNYLRSELKNKISVKITEMLSLSFKHRWFYYYYLKTGDKYSNSQFITSIDLNTDFKI